MRVKLIPYIIYPFDLMVFFNAKYPEIEKRLKERLPEGTHREINIYLNRVIQHGRTVMFSTGQTVIVLNDQNKGIVSHEIFHAVSLLFDKIGIKLSNKSDEAYAYMIEYVTNQVYKK